MALGPRLVSSFVYVPKSQIVSYFKTDYVNRVNRKGIHNIKYHNRKLVVPLRDEELYQRLLLVLYTSLNDWGILNSMPREKVDFLTEILSVIYYMNDLDSNDDLKVDTNYKI